MNFTSLNLEEPLLKAIEELNYQEPTPIQSQVIPLLLEDNHDLVGLAQTGTGKTAAFGLPLLQLIELDEVIPQALILCPTRELCIQITKDLENYAKHLSKMKVLSVYGGAPIDKQIRALKKGVHLLVATPGRLNDLIRRKKVNLSRIERVVLDEADEMLNMGFQEELDFILEELPHDRNTLLFSATMPKSVQKIAEKYMNEPIEVTIGEKNASSEMVTHSYHVVYEKDRYKALKRIVDTYPDMYSIIFCRTRMDTHKIATHLMQDGYAVDSLHGDLSQPMRDRVMEKFRHRNFNILVATDVAARGLDVNNLTHVIHYHLPEDVEYYNHRSGRTGRAGSKGLSISIINPKEKFKIKRLEKILKKPFEFKLLSSGEEVCKAKLFHIVNRVKNVEIDEERIAPFLPEIYESFGGMNWQELIQRFVSLEFGLFLEEYQDLQDLNAMKEEKGHSTPKQREGNYSLNQRVRLVLNFGKRDGFTLKDLILLVNRATKGYRVELGQIVLLQRKTLFEVEEDDVDLVMNSLNENSSFKKKKVVVMLDRDQSPDKMPSRRDSARRKSKKTRKFKHRGKSKKEMFSH